MGQRSKALSLISLATKAQKTVSGEFCTEKEVKSGAAALVVIANDASDNTKKKFRNMCDFYEVPFYQFGEMEMLGHSIGKQERTSLAVLNEGFADSIQKHLEDSGIGRR